MLKTSRPMGVDVSSCGVSTGGMGATEVARKLKIGRASVYRILEDATGDKAGPKISG